jgi:glycerol-3-phosphate acyltransferase PlsY
MVTAGALLLAYLVGSIPSGYLLVRVAKGLDVRRYGSHNVGAINVVRVGGPWLGLATLCADVGKAAAVVFVTKALALPTSVVAAAAFLVLAGHAYSIWFLLREGQFAEGKSVACALGVMLGLGGIGALPWHLALAPLGVWSFGLLAPRLVTGRWWWISPATMLATTAMPVAVWVAHPGSPYLVLSGAMAALILVRHKNNIKRLLSGTEPRLGERLANTGGDSPPEDPSKHERIAERPRLQAQGGGP